MIATSQEICKDRTNPGAGHHCAAVLALWTTQQARISEWGSWGEPDPKEEEVAVARHRLERTVPPTSIPRDLLLNLCSDPRQLPLLPRPWTSKVLNYHWPPLPLPWTTTGQGVGRAVKSFRQSTEGSERPAYPHVLTTTANTPALAEWWLAGKGWRTKGGVLWDITLNICLFINALPPVSKTREPRPFFNHS